MNSKQVNLCDEAEQFHELIWHRALALSKEINPVVMIKSEGIPDTDKNRTQRMIMAQVFYKKMFDFVTRRLEN